MSIERLTVAAQTNASGAATLVTPSFTGRLLAIHWVKPASGGITGATFAVTSVNTGEAVLSVSSISSSQDWYPRGPVHTVAGVAQLYAAAGLPITDQLAFFEDQLQIVISSGGNALVGTFTFIIDGQAS
jgi:hypothetical protein